MRVILDMCDHSPVESDINNNKNRGETKLGTIVVDDLLNHHKKVPAPSTAASTKRGLMEKKIQYFSQ